MIFFRKNYSTKTDEELMLLLTKGGQSAFDELYKRYSKPLLNFFFRLLNNDREKAEDMLHDLFLKIIETPENFDNTKKFSTWFYTLANNMIKNEYRCMQVRNQHEEYQLNFAVDFFERNNESIDQELFKIQLEKEINKMNSDTKMIFNLRFVEEMTVKQIAEIMECPEGTIKSRLFYLTKQLSAKLSVFNPEIN